MFASIKQTIIVAVILFWLSFLLHVLRLQWYHWHDMMTTMIFIWINSNLSIIHSFKSIVLFDWRDQIAWFLHGLKDTIFVFQIHPQSFELIEPIRNYIQIKWIRQFCKFDIFFEWCCFHFYIIALLLLLLLIDIVMVYYCYW